MKPNDFHSPRSDTHPRLSPAPSEIALIPICFSEYVSDASSEESTFTLQSDLRLGSERLPQTDFPLRCSETHPLFGTSSEQDTQEVTVRLPDSRLCREPEKVDILHALLLQREAQKEVYFQDSVRKGKECVALKTELLGLKEDLIAKECECDSLLKSQKETEVVLKEKVRRLKAANTDLQQVSHLLETQTQELVQALAAAEQDKLTLMKDRTVLQARLATQSVATPVKQPLVLRQSTASQAEVTVQAERVSVNSVVACEEQNNSHMQLWSGLLLSFSLVVYVLTQVVRDRLLVI